MTRGLYTAYTGMYAQQQRMDTISNNLANVNTAGYKKDGVLFKSFDEVYTMKINDPEQIGGNRIGKSNFGVRTGDVYTDFKQGSFMQTDDPLNIALDGQGMVAVGSFDSEGNIITKYTRDGSFGLSPKGEMVTKDGFFVLGEKGPITINSSNVRIDQQGKIYVNDKYQDTLQLTDFENSDTLKKMGGGIYDVTKDTIIKEFEGTIIQGFVEASNVNSVEEMINMINVMRTYEANQKIMTTYDATMDKAVNEVGRL